MTQQHLDFLNSHEISDISDVKLENNVITFRDLFFNRDVTISTLTQLKTFLGY